MKIQAKHSNFVMPEISTVGSAGYDILMPEAGTIKPHETKKVGLGFAAEVPLGYAALLLPRSSAAKAGIALANTVGLIDSDYRGEWIAAIRLEKDLEFRWDALDRLFQFILVPIITPELVQVDSLLVTQRGEGGFGSTGR